MINNPPGRLNFTGGIYSGKGVGWPAGVDSFSHPLYVNELQVRWLENAVTQGGFIQTRPGYKTRLTWDTNVNEANAWWQSVDGPIVHPQMLMRFTPTSGQQQLVFAISGSIFYSLINNDGSLSSPILITTLQFNQNADQIVGCRCVQSATIIAGQYANNIAPRNLLVIQDGYNRAGIWDGVTGVHMNPTKMIETEDDNTLYPEAYNQTRIGLWMAWSGNRLWISNGPNVYASDLNDPTHFTEELSLQNVPVFTFEDEVTGMIDRGTSGTNRSQVIVFTANTTETLWSGVQNRAPSDFGQGWAYTTDFRTKIFDGVGCVAGKSVGVHRGLLYWKSATGIVMFDSSATVNSSQNLPPIDQEMAYSKLRIVPSAVGADLTCFGKMGSYVFWSVPVGNCINGRRYTAQTQVLDRQTTVVRSVGVGGAFQAGTTGWQGIWTGIKPVEWASAMVQGVEAAYALCLDSEGVVRIWQGFQSNRADNGHRIPWFVESRCHPVQPSIFEYGIFRHFRLLLDQIEGNVEVVGYWKGLKGTYHELLTQEMTATPGSMFATFSPYQTMTATTPIKTFALQGRTVLSRSHQGDAECSAEQVESQYTDSIDHAFSIAVRFNGRAALSGYMIAADTKADNTEGTDRGATGIDESGFNVVPTGGCPEHIDGETPDYVHQDQPQQLAQCPFLPAESLVLEYTAPHA